MWSVFKRMPTGANKSNSTNVERTLGIVAIIIICIIISEKFKGARIFKPFVANLLQLIERIFSGEEIDWRNYEER